MTAVLPDPRLSSRNPLADLLTRGQVRTLFHPIVDLQTGETVAFEALSRGPSGSPLEGADALFGRAADAGRLPELDRLCRRTALRTAAESGLAPETALFVNADAASLTAPGADDDLHWDSHGITRLVLEVTERALTRDPAGLLAAVRTARRRGWGIAVDDLGAEVASLALLPLLRPDVVKLDLSLIQRRPDREIARIVSAVTAYAETTGAELVAEGIETDRHIFIAQAMGARLGQGWLFGRPGPIPGGLRPARSSVTVSRRAEPDTASGGASLLPGKPTWRRVRKPLLVQISRHLEAEAADLGGSAVIVGAFQAAERFTPSTTTRWRELGRVCSLAVALGAGMAREPVPGVRGGHLSPGDPLLDEWNIAVLGPHFAATMVAVDLGDGGSESERRFDYVLTYDRATTVRVATAMINRAAPPG